MWAWHLVIWEKFIVRNTRRFCKTQIEFDFARWMADIRYPVSETLEM